MGIEIEVPTRPGRFQQKTKINISLRLLNGSKIARFQLFVINR